MKYYSENTQNKEEEIAGQKNTKAAIAILAVIAVLAILAAVGAGILAYNAIGALKNLGGNGGFSVSLPRIPGSGSENGKGDEQTAGGEKNVADDGTSENGNSDKANNDSTRDEDSKANDALLSNSDEKLLSLIRDWYRNDFIAEDVVSCHTILVDTEDYMAEARFFFPSFEEDSNVACGWFVYMKNLSDTDCAFLFEGYHVNARMIKGEYDVMELESGESTPVFVYLTKETLFNNDIKGLTESAGFRVKVRDGGRYGSEDISEEYCVFLKNGTDETPAPSDDTDYTERYADEDLVLKTADAVVDREAKTVTIPYYFVNRTDTAMSFGLNCMVDGKGVGSDGALVAAHCDIRGIITISKTDLEIREVAIDDAKEISLFMEISAYTKPGEKNPWSTLLVKPVNIPF